MAIEIEHEEERVESATEGSEDGRGDEGRDCAAGEFVEVLVEICLSAKLSRVSEEERMEPATEHEEERVEPTDVGAEDGRGDEGRDCAAGGLMRL